LDRLCCALSVQAGVHFDACQHEVSVHTCELDSRQSRKGYMLCCCLVWCLTPDPILHLRVLAPPPAGYGPAHLAMAGYLRARDGSRPVSCRPEGTCTTCAWL